MDATIDIKRCDVVIDGSIVWVQLLKTSDVVFVEHSLMWVCDVYIVDGKKTLVCK